MARKWVYEREKEKKQKIWNRMHEKDQVREDMLWKSGWRTPKEYPYRPEMQAAKVNAVGIFDEKLDYAKQAAAGWAQHQTDQVRKQAVLRDPNYQKWQQATGYVIEDDEDWHPQNDWSSTQNNNFGYLYSKNPQEARNYAALVNRENRSLRELGSQRVRTGMPERQGIFDRATDFLTDVWNRNSEAQATNSRLAMEQGLKNGERARKAFDSAGQSLAAQSDMNRQAADKSADAISEQAKKTAKNWSNANLAYSKAQTKQAEQTGEFAKRTKQHWEAANGAYSEAQTEQARRIGEQANETSRKYGAIWALTSGVTGSDQTGASIWGYRNAGDHKVNQGDYQQSVEKIRGQIADGGADAALHALAARGLSGGKTLDDYNRFLEYSATGKISEESTLTPGTYAEEVDKAIAEYLTKQYGVKASNIYNKVTGTFDQIASFATLGPEISLIKGSMDLAGDTLNKRLGNGASNKEAVEAGFMKGIHNAGKELLVDGALGFAVKKSPNDQVKEAFDGRKGEVLKDAVGAVVNTLVDNNDVTTEFEMQKKRWKKEGYSEKQAERIAMAEIMKQKGKDVFENASLSAVQRSFYEALRGSVK